MASTSALRAGTWNVSSGNWNVSGNWKGGAPSLGVSAYIVNGGTALLPIGVTGAASTLYLGDVSSGTISITGGLLKDQDSYIGGNASSVGSVAISSGTWNNSGDLYVGRSGTGNLNITGGTVTSTGSAYLGYNAGSTGVATILAAAHGVPGPASS